MVCTTNDLTRSLKIKNADILGKADELITRMRYAIRDLSPFDLECRDIDWIVNYIKEQLTEDVFKMDFFEWGDRYILTKTPSTRRSYSAALNAFERFLGERQIDINAITKLLLLDFMKFIDEEPKIHFNYKTREYEHTSVQKIAKGAATRHLMKLQNIFNAAKDRYNDEDTYRIVIPRSPFDKIPKEFPASHGQKNLGQPLMQKIISCQVSDPVVRYALDAFIVSFGLMGANMADLYCATPVHDTWIYNRQKTKTRRDDQAEMRVDVPAELEPYIARLQSHKGKGWWLPTLHYLGNNKDLCTARVNKSLKRWCIENDIPVFTFYAARHTWASLARKAGIEKATIDECLVHKGDFDMADIYAERSWELISAANKKVLQMFEWE